VRLVESHGHRGVVLDLGCGYAAVGEVLRDAGWQYVGGDRDADAVADIVSRGLEGHVVDLAAGEGFAGRLTDLIAGRRVGAVMMLDIIEHLPDPNAVLGALAELSWSLATDGVDAPVLVTSIPNVAHFDLGAKLVGGRWDVTPSACWTGRTCRCSQSSGHRRARPVRLAGVVAATTSSWSTRTSGFLPITRSWSRRAGPRPPPVAEVRR